MQKFSRDSCSFFLYQSTGHENVYNVSAVLIVVAVIYVQSATFFTFFW